MSGRYHTLVVRVENKPGVLARVAGLFARRGFNIYSLTVAPTDDEKISRITIIVDVASAPLEQVVKQLDKLINVVEIRELDPEHAVEREYLMATVRAEGQARNDVTELVSMFRGHVINIGDDKVMVSLGGPPSQVDDFENRLEAFGIVEVQRTGKLALAKIES